MKNKKTKSKTMKKTKTIITTKNTQLKKILKKTLKNSKISHFYYINRCLYNNKLSSLDDSILEHYLQKLGLKPNNHAMKTIQAEDNKIKNKHNLSYIDFCNFNKLIQPYKNTKNIDSLINSYHTDVFFFNINSKFLDKRFYKYPSYLLNTLNIDFLNITTKHNLYNYILSKSKDYFNTYKKYFIETFPILERDKYQFPSYYILRPIDSFGGKDIKYINNENQLNNAITFYKTHKNYKSVIYGNNVITSPYITDLLLFQEKKFHLRMYFLVSCINGIINSFLLDYGEIITANKKFDMELPFTTDKHDTHVKSTEKYYTFKHDFNENNLNKTITDTDKHKIYESCKNICKILTDLILEKTGSNKEYSKILYDNQKNGYYIFGLDVFIKNNLEPILIECNEKPGFNTKNNKDNKHLSNLIYGWINEIILESLFKYNDPLIPQKHKTFVK